jgi:hypothetical protein
MINLFPRDPGDRASAERPSGASLLLPEGGGTPATTLSWEDLGPLRASGVSLE